MISSVFLGVTGFLWFVSGEYDDFLPIERNLFTKLLHLSTVLIILFEIFIAYLEYRPYVELKTSIALWVFKSLLLISGPKLALPLVLFLRYLLSLKYLFERLKPMSTFLQAAVLFLSVSLFYRNTGHLECPYTLPVA